MAYCPECGTEVEEGQSYCEECGTALDTEDSVIKETGEAETSTDDETTTKTDDENDNIDWKQVGLAAIIGFLPALGAYIGISIAFFDPVPSVLLITWPVFGYLLYQRKNTKGMIGGASYWLAIEALLTPLVLLIYTFSFASQEATTGVEQAGAAIGGFILVIMAFVVGLPVGIVLYLISRRLDTDADTTTGTGSG